MHKSSMLRMEWFRDTYAEKMGGNPVKIADIGSQKVSGQTDAYRQLFPKPKFKYAGVDMEAGDNVDIKLRNPYQWAEIARETFDIAISGQAFEHIEFPWITIEEMARIVKPGGLVCIIAPSMAPLHRYPVHCQNYFSDGLIALARYARLEVLHASTNLAPPGSPSEWYYGDADSMMVARKPAGWNYEDSFDAAKYEFKPADLDRLSSGMASKSKSGHVGDIAQDYYDD